MLPTSFFLPLWLARSALALAPSGPWDAFNFAPKSRTVYATVIRTSAGTVTNADNLLRATGSATLDPESWVTLDFGQEARGLISLNFDDVGDNSSLALSFTESPSFIRPTASDDSTFPDATTTYDGVLPVAAPLPTGYWTQPAYALRGGFRFLTLVSTGADALMLSNVSCAISFMPHFADLRAYTGYFSAPDPGFHDPDFLTKIWMAGAYTVQTNTVGLHTGRQIPVVSQGWANNATLGIAGPIIVDGAKRDRAVWPGDMGIAVPTQFVSTNDLIPTRNALGTMFSNINPVTGALPESGPPLSQLGSDTYHCWTLIGTHNYYLYSGDIEWLQTIWANYTKAVAFLENKVDPAVGLMNITGLRDWARQGGGGFNAEGNAIFYRVYLYLPPSPILIASPQVLVTSASLASAMNLSSLSDAWTKNASDVKTAYNTAFWVPELGMFRDNMTTTLTPQDGNSFAVLFNLTTSPAQAASVSAGLEKNWNALGAVAPELPDTISPFIGGFELQAHFTAGNATRAMDLLHREWGYILYTNLSVQSTLLEGFTANGSLAYRANVGYNDDPAYTSHSHGWSSGPTSALTIYVVGLSVTAPQGSAWLLSPNLAGLPSAEGGFETPLGWFGASWTVSTRGGTTTFSVSVDVPEGTAGVFALPQELRGGSVSVKVDGRAAVLGANDDMPLSGGKHTVSVVARG
ncbi:Six-hairpin glycosidase [Mycena maculata]|uniref:Six-hairpin glycosidase n=1 Tax=Mycena maculata TaxID=230809 RepID=A0AAD7IJW4_9AGAR|nr:Six-hairpin glycosidase [Mycena maculata]